MIMERHQIATELKHTIPRLSFFSKTKEKWLKQLLAMLAQTACLQGNIPSLHKSMRESQSASTSSSSIADKLNCLQDLYDNVYMFVQLPITQQALAQEQRRKSVEELLDGSLVLLDVCGTAKDALLQAKECTQELQSILRRRRGVEGLANEVRKYLTSRKAVRKAICEALKNLKRASSFSKDGETGTVISTLKQVEVATISVLESLLSFISGPEAAESKSGRWSLVSKLMHQKRVTCEEEEEQRTNEIANAEAALRSFVKSGNIKDVEIVQNELQNSEMCIQDLEEGLESIFRRLIKARVTVLNILNC